MRAMILLISSVFLAAAPADAAIQHASKAEAVTMVKRVEAMFKKDGATATFKAVDDKSNKEFHKGDLYPFIFTLKGKCVAHGATPSLIGKNLIDLKDPDGEYTVRVSIKIAESAAGHGWLYYKWPNPITHKIENKASYIENLGHKYFVGAGIYLK